MHFLSDSQRSNVKRPGLLILALERNQYSSVDTRIPHSQESRRDGGPYGNIWVVGVQPISPFTIGRRHTGSASAQLPWKGNEKRHDSVLKAREAHCGKKHDQQPRPVVKRQGHIGVPQTKHLSRMDWDRSQRGWPFVLTLYPVNGNQRVGVVDQT